MAKANLNAAKVYLRVLAKTLFEADWANGYLDKLELDPELASDTRIQHMRSVMMLKKHDSLSVKYEQLLPNLLYANQRNRMAFEYLMGWYLLSAQLDKVVQNLYRLNDFNYLQIPQLYEEAILLYMFRTKKQVDLHGRQISLQSRRRFEDFKQIFSYHNENKRAAFRDLAKTS